MTPAPLAAVLSFRLGGTDGVSVEAEKWRRALEALGYRVRRVAGAILDGGHDGDLVVPGLAIPATTEPDAHRVEQAVERADLVVVENLLSLPLNLPAARTVAKVVSGHGRLVVRHHDLPWQRPEHRDVTELPPALPDALHVTINDHSRHELAERGVAAHTLRNHFDLSPPVGDRSATRRDLGLGERDVLLLHPVRAIARKNVPGALELAAAVAERLPGRRVHYWLPGPAEDGYAPTLDALLRDPPVAVIRRERTPIADAYAACDAVVFPSCREGFGNPVIESVAARRPVAVHRYPALCELEELGFRFLDADEPEELAAILSGARDPEPMLEHDLAVARRHLDLEDLPRRLGDLLAAKGLSLP